MMIPPFEHDGFENLKKDEAKEYFEWYVNQVEYRIEVLKNCVLSESEGVMFDYTPDSLVALWSWYEKKIKIVNKTKEEIEQEMSRYPNWMHNEISNTKISVDTLKYGMDIAIYFAEVIIRNTDGRIHWGYFTSPKKRMSVNEPILLGFMGDMDLNPRLIVLNCTRRSSRENNNNRLLEMYNVWMNYID